MNRRLGSLFGRRRSSGLARTPSFTTSGSGAGKTLFDPPPYSEVSQGDFYTNGSGATRQLADPDDSQYAFLEKFDTVFLVDDSASMAFYGRWQEAEAAISAITPVCTKYDADGIDIHFLNGGPREGFTNVASPSAVREIFQSVRPRGGTFVGTKLHRILGPYMSRVENMVAHTNSTGYLDNPSLYVRPMNIIVITDGEFSDDVERIILNAAETLHLHRKQVNPCQLGIQFVQIGNDSKARRYLERLDDDLVSAAKAEGISVLDIVDTVPWKGTSNQTITADYLLKIVLGSVNRRLDRQKA